MAVKTVDKTVFFDGANLKSINPWDLDSDKGWLVGNRVSRDDLYFLSVPWLYRGVKDRSNSVGTIPFVITRGEIEIDTSSGYKNALGILPAPAALFKRLEMSLVMAGRAYILLERNKNGYVKNLKYVVATSIKEHYNSIGEVDWYDRTINATTIKITVEDIVPLYDADYTTENGPGQSSAARAAMTSAGVLYQADVFIEKYFERGAIKATILTTKGFGQVEADRTQRWWDDVVSGVRNAWAAIVVKGDEIKPVVIGEGLDSLQNDALTTERRQNIATALGLPESRLWSSAANYATAQQDTKNYYSSTIIPDCELIAESFNSRIFTPANRLDGYHIEFTPESLAIYQTDAQAQAGALGQLTGAGVPLIMAMELLGFDLTDGQRIELAPKEITPPALVDTPAPIAPVVETAPVEPNPLEVQTAMRNWQHKALYALKKTGCASVEFVSSLISDTRAAEITDGLKTATTVDEVKAIFDTPIDYHDPIARAVDWLESHTEVKAEVQPAPALEVVND